MKRYLGPRENKPVFVVIIVYAENYFSSEENSDRNAAKGAAPISRCSNERVNIASQSACITMAAQLEQHGAAQDLMTTTPAPQI